MTEILEVTEHIAAPAAAVWPYLTDPDLYVRWMGSVVRLEASPGGAYDVFMREGVMASGTFVEVDPPKRLVFTWGWDHDPLVAPGTTRVEIELEEVADGTRVRLRHYDLPDQESCEHHRQGWLLYLDRMSTVAAGGDPGPDPNAAASSPD